MGDGEEFQAGRRYEQLSHTITSACYEVIASKSPRIHREKLKPIISRQFSELMELYLQFPHDPQEFKGISESYVQTFYPK